MCAYQLERSGRDAGNGAHPDRAAKHSDCLTAVVYPALVRGASPCQRKFAAGPVIPTLVCQFRGGIERKGVGTVGKD
jgi:hypothetical protein